jgi:RNA polymerase sigma factor (sigma-70 family)
MIEKEKTYIAALSKEERLEWLMNEYGQSVTRLAFTYTKQKQLSEDIAQEVFIKCYQNMDTFRHESSYRTWVYRITVNLCKDKVRSWSFRNLVFTDLFKSNSTMHTPETEVLYFEHKRIISEKIMSLPVKYREVIILFYYEDMSYNQIADLLNINLQTIKNRLHRARLLLKKMLDGGNYDG